MFESWVSPPLSRVLRLSHAPPMILRALVPTVIMCSVATAAEPSWTPLFNGRDLSGWRQVNGKATYTVENGAIVGETIADSPNSFLATEQEYGDFILEYEVRMESGKELNSGVQFRSISKPDVLNGKVHGYQCEIDPSSRGWSGGIYDESRRGWLYPVSLNPAGLNQFKVGEWNTFRIEAMGSSIRTSLNGVPIAYVIDDVTPRGLIALQVHSISSAAEAGRKVAWRNIRIQTENLQGTRFPNDVFVRNLMPNTVARPEASRGWRMLWDGKTTQGWRSARAETFPTAGWEIKDGVLNVVETGGAEAAAAGDIITVDQFKDFELQLEFKISEGANSGIKYYVQPALNQGKGSAIGLEYQILDDAKHPDAKQGRDGNRTVASLYDLITADPKKPKVVPGQWYHARIVSKGAQVEHWLNGMKVVSYERGSPAFRENVAVSKYKVWENFGEWPQGHILLQDHGNVVAFRSIKIRTF